MSVLRPFQSLLKPSVTSRNQGKSDASIADGLRNLRDGSNGVTGFSAPTLSTAMTGPWGGEFVALILAMYSMMAMVACVPLFLWVYFEPVPLHTYIPCPCPTQPVQSPIIAGF